MSGNKDKHDDAFIRQYAAQIAEALRQQEETPQQDSVEDSLPVFYRSLCFDEPMIDDIYNLPIVASALSRQLLSKSSLFALSNRFVNGIVFLCQQKRNAQSGSNNSSGDNSNANTRTTTTTNPSSTAMAKLAFCVLILVPLECCTYFENLEISRQFLGSYKGSLQQQQQQQQRGEENEPVRMDEDLTTKDTTTQQEVERLAQAINETQIAVTDSSDNNAGDDSSLQEVWAADSDPSDYDYGEGSPGMLPQQEQLLLNYQDDWLDPLVLSKADPSLTREQARSAIGSLLQQANYTLLEPIFTTSLSRADVDSYISKVTQLLLVLLHPQNIMANGDSMDASWQNAILSPLWVLRDAALHSPEHQHFTNSYLEVVQTLLAVDQAHLQDVAGQIPAKKIELCSASIVGLSALSSWCSMITTLPKLIQVTVQAIVDSMNDLAHVVERASANYKENLTHSLVPVLELMSGIPYEQAKTTMTISSEVTTTAQVLLNSGLLRQILVLALEENEEGRAPHRFHHALWSLCAVYPKNVGKYVSRYPGIPQLVRQYCVQADSSSRDCVHSIMWNAFGWTQCADSSQLNQQAPRVVWKTKNPLSQTQAPSLSQDECQEVCQKSWIKMCQIVEQYLQDSANNPKEALAVLEDFERLLSFAAVPSIASAFGTLVDSSQLRKISNLLPGLSQQQQQQEKGEISDEVSVEQNIKDDSEEHDKKKSPSSKQQIVVSKVRKLLKQYTLFFQGNVKGSFKTD